MNAVAAMRGNTDLEVLKQLNEKYVASVESSNHGWFEEHLAGDFMNSNPDGTLVNRAQFIAQITRPCPLSNIKAHDVLIRIMGDTAIIHARTSYKRADGQSGAGRYTDIWTKGGQGWLCVAAHVTRV